MAAAAAAKQAAVRYATKPLTGDLPTCVDVFHGVDLRDISWSKKKIQAALFDRGIELKDNQMVHFVNSANTKARSIARVCAGVYVVWCWIVDNEGNWHSQHAMNSTALQAYAGNKKVDKLLERIAHDASARAEYRSYRQRLAADALEGR